MPCTWRAPQRTAAIALATAQPVSSWQWMPRIDVVAEVGLDDADDLLDLVRQRAAVGVAQHEVARALDGGCLERAQGELGIAFVAIEEVLGVDHHPQAVRRARYSTESAIIASPSSSVVLSAFSTW